MYPSHTRALRVCPVTHNPSNSAQILSSMLQPTSSPELTPYNLPRRIRVYLTQIHLQNPIPCTLDPRFSPTLTARSMARLQGVSIRLLKLARTRGGATAATRPVYRNFWAASLETSMTAFCFRKVMRTSFSCRSSCSSSGVH